MPKPKAERWLTQGFADGIDLRDGKGYGRPPYRGASPWCWLARFDPARRPCTDKLERFHFVRRQDVEAWVWGQLREAVFEETGWWVPTETRDELMLLAAWDSRNGKLGCDGHHARLDQHAVSLPSERIVITYADLPPHVVQFGFDWSDGALLDRFPSSI